MGTGSGDMIRGIENKKKKFKEIYFFLKKLGKKNFFFFFFPKKTFKGFGKFKKKGGGKRKRFFFPLPVYYKFIPNLKSIVLEELNCFLCQIQFSMFLWFLLRCALVGVAGQFFSINNGEFGCELCIHIISIDFCQDGCSLHTGILPAPWSLQVWARMLRVDLQSDFHQLGVLAVVAF